jgi:hypothetical protein
MNTLISIRHNPIYKKTSEKDAEKEEFERHNEIILLVDKPEYFLNNEGEVTRNRSVQELRFNVGEKALDGLIEALTIIKENI